MNKSLLVSSLLILLVSNFNPVIASPGDITRVSLPTFGSQGNGDSNYPSISSDGRYVAFESNASNLVVGDSNGFTDIFVHDRQTGVNTRVSVHSSGLQGNGHSENAAISADGRYVAFLSSASNLVAGDSNNQTDIFVHDRNTGVTSRVSVATGGGQSNGSSSYPAISGDGRYVAFASVATNLVASDTNSLQDVFIHDRNSNTTTRISVGAGGVQASGASLSPSLSGDGQVVAFTSIASNLVAGDTNDKNDIFVNEWSKNTVTRVSVVSFGGQANGDSYGASISADGNYVVFYSYATNLVDDDTNKAPDIFLHERIEGVTTRVSVGSGGNQANSDSGGPAISPDGFFLAFESNANNLIGGDGNGSSDVFLHTWENTETFLVSKTQSGSSGNDGSYYASISQYGNYVAFVSSATNLVDGDTNGMDDIFVFDRVLGVMTRISVPSAQNQGNSDSFLPSISSDGRFVAFVSAATNLVVGDSNGKYDVFVHDRQTAITTRVSVHSNGSQANGDSFNPSISGDGRYVAYHSDSSNLVDGDTNGSIDIFIHDRQSGITTIVSLDSSGNQANNDSFNPSISANGQFIVFQSAASDLVSGDSNLKDDIFLRDILNETTIRLSVDSDEVQSDGYSVWPSISSDGHFVAFESDATNLVSGDTNAYKDIFVRDIQAGTTSRVSVASDGEQSNWHASYPSISGNGRLIAFASGATNLVVGDTNGISDIFVYDRQLSTTKIIPYSMDPGATPYFARIPTISANGDIVVFASIYLILSNPDNYLAEFITIHNLASGKTNRVECNDLSNPCYHSVSGDGRFVSFQSAYPKVAGDTNSVSDIFVYENEVKTYVFLPMLVR